jgi:hypothetical protein
LATLKIITALALGSGSLNLEMVPPTLRPAVEAYRERFRGIPKTELHLSMFENIYTLPAEERRFVTQKRSRQRY